MKKLLVVIAVAVSGFVNGQCYTLLTQSQNKLLDTYGIDYTGLHTRYIMSTNQIEEIVDSESKIGMINSYSKFTKWNKNRLQIVPDINNILLTGTEYIKDKNLADDSQVLFWLLNDSHHLLQKLKFDINRDGIKSIEIVEFHMTEYENCIYLYHMIFIEHFDGSWSNLDYDINDTSLDCPFCVVP